MLLNELTQALNRLNLAQVAPGDYGKTGCHLEVEAAPAQVPEVAQVMLEKGCFLESLTAVDFPEHFTLVYHFNHFRELCRTVVRARVPKEAAAPTISHIYPAANWYEREVYDLFGLTFAGHPDMRRILLPFEADFHPLRKKFAPSETPADA